MRNLARLGTSRRDLIDVYYKQCRSVLELAAPAWTPGLTKTEINQLERVQKAACAIILGKQFYSYKAALRILNMETLESRRFTISLRFARKALNSEKFKEWFAMNETSDRDMKTRASKTKCKLKPVTYKRRRYKNSPIPHLTELLNNHS